MVDDSTVSISLTAPSNSFLQQLAIWPASIVPSEVIEKGGNKWTEAGTLVGSGPFLLKEWAHNDHITLVANPNWHGGRARLNEVRIKIPARGHDGLRGVPDGRPGHLQRAAGEP